MTTKPDIPISESEAKIMEVVWAKPSMTADQIIEKLAESESWQPPTIKSLINRLLKKGALLAEADGRRYLYRAAISRQEYVASESGSLLDRLFGGKVAPLVSHFAEQQKLSKRDIAALRKLLDELDD